MELNLGTSHLIFYLFLTFAVTDRIGFKTYVTLGESCDDEKIYCYSPLFCHRNKCMFVEKAFGGKCTKNYQCRSPFVCNDGYCDHQKVIGKSCQYDHNCRKGLFCRLGVCEDLS